MCIHACTDPYEYVIICICTSETKPDLYMRFATLPLKVNFTSWVKTLALPLSDNLTGD